MFNGGVDVSHMISTMDELKTETSEADPGTRTRGIVTTNIIGHGVDVDRFNVIVFAGLVAMHTLPIEQYPNITPPLIQVQATYNGANADTMANDVASPLEQE